MTKKVNNETNKIEGKVPTVNALEKRFYFIEDDVLRMNIAISFQYIIFLIAVIEKEKVEKSTISSSIYKNIIFYTATVIEGCLHYYLKRYINLGVIKISDAIKPEWITKNHKKIYPISSIEHVCSAIRYKKEGYLTNQTSFIVINRACEKAGILTNDIFLKVEELREKRNKIHLVGLRAIDDTYSKDDSKRVFEIATEIIESIEKKLQKVR